MGMYVDNTTSSDIGYYIHTDYLGSVIALSDDDGDIIQEYSYDAWGKRRDPNDWRRADTRLGFICDRGYTGHEHLDEFDLINMNGRVYDPHVAMFLSPDPVLQDPGNTLNFNRYSYAFNNPLKYTDPSGYITAPMRFSTWHGRNNWVGGLHGGGGSLYSFYSNIPHIANSRFGASGGWTYNDNSGEFENVFSGETANNYTNTGLNLGITLNGENAKAFATALQRPRKPIGGHWRTFNRKTGQRTWKYKYMDVFDLASMFGEAANGGGVTFGQALRHYQYGNGVDMHVDISKINLSMISADDFGGKVGNQAQINIFGRKKLSTAGLVFGSIRFEYLGNNQVKVVDYFPEGTPLAGQPYYDTYNYNIRWNEGFTSRNIGTGIGWMISRFPFVLMPDVTPYKIYFHGTGTIGGN